MTSQEYYTLGYDSMEPGCGADGRTKNCKYCVWKAFTPTHLDVACVQEKLCIWYLQNMNGTKN